MKAIELKISDSERATLESWRSSKQIDQRLSRRAIIILDSVNGVKADETARRIGVYPYVVSKWRKRFHEQGLAGLRDAARSGKPSVYGSEVEARVLELIKTKPPVGIVGWNGRIIAEVIGNISCDYVWRILRKHGIHLMRRNSKSGKKTVKSSKNKSTQKPHA